MSALSNGAEVHLRTEHNANLVVGTTYGVVNTTRFAMHVLVEVGCLALRPSMLRSTALHSSLQNDTQSGANGVRRVPA